MFLGRIAWRAVTGRRLRGQGERDDIAKLRLLCLLWGGFFSGALIGAWWGNSAWVQANPWYDLLPAEAFIFILMLAYFTFRVVVLHRHFFPPRDEPVTKTSLRVDAGAGGEGGGARSSNHGSARAAPVDAAAATAAATSTLIGEEAKEQTMSFGREDSFQGGSFRCLDGSHRRFGSAGSGVELASSSAFAAIGEEEEEEEEEEPEEEKDVKGVGAGGEASELESGGSSSSASLSPFAVKRKERKACDVDSHQERV